MGTKSTTVNESVSIPPPTEHELELQRSLVSLVDKQIENLTAQGTFQDNFFEELRAQGINLEDLSAFADENFNLETQRQGLAQDAITRTEEFGAQADEALNAQAANLQNALAEIDASTASPAELEQLKQEQFRLVVEQLDNQQAAMQSAAARGELTEEAAQAQIDAITSIADVVNAQPELSAAQREVFNQGLIANAQATTDLQGGLLADAIANGAESSNLIQLQVSIVKALEKLEASQPTFTPERQAEINDRLLNLQENQITLRETELQQSIDNGLLTQDAFNTQAEAYTALRTQLDNIAVFSSAEQAQFNKTQLELAQDTVSFQQESLEASAARGDLTEQAFAAQVSAFESLRVQLANQPQFDAATQAEFNEKSLGIQNSLADLKQQQVDQAISKASSEDELFASLVENVRNTGQATPEQLEQISQVMSGAENAGIARIELNRDLTLAELRSAKDANLGNLDSAVASALFGINSDVFERVSDLESSTGVALEDIDTMSQDALENVRDVLAPSRGLRTTDTPIVARGFEIAREQVRAKGRAINDFQRAKQALERGGAGQSAEVQAQALRDIQRIESEFTAATGQAFSQATQLKGELSSRIASQTAEAQLNFPLQVQRQQADIATRAIELSQAGGESVTAQGQREEEAALNFAVGGAQVVGEGAARVAAQTLSDQQFQQELANVIEIARTGQPLNIAVAQSGIASGLSGQLSQNQQFQLAIALQEEQLRLETTLATAGLSAEVAAATQQQIAANSQFLTQVGEAQRQDELEFGVSAATATSNIATGQQVVSDAATEFQQSVGLDTQRKIQTDATSSSVLTAGLTGDILNQQQAQDEFQAQLKQNAEAARLNLSSGTGSLGLGLASIGSTASASGLAIEADTRTAQTTTTGTSTTRDPAATIGALGGLFTGIGAL